MVQRPPGGPRLVHVLLRQQPPAAAARFGHQLSDVVVAHVLVHDLQEELGQVREPGDLRGQPRARDEIREGLGGPVVEHVPVRQEHGRGELVEHLHAGLVDGQHHRAAVLAQAVQRLHDRERRGRVQARGGLVQEDEPGLVDGVHPDGHAALLAPAQPPGQLVAHHRVRHALQLQRPQRLRHHLGFLRAGLPRDAQLGREHEGLPHSQQRIQGIGLHDVTRNTFVVGSDCYSIIFQ
mmetsp:Transcript_44254/g.69255  ORF Transcript_44254/g.69255 Transcript_44254/m.69255 type:complete len:236 (-) Transcript_44254:204-911(-)